MTFHLVALHFRNTTVGTPCVVTEISLPTNIPVITEKSMNASPPDKPPQSIPKMDMYLWITHGYASMTWIRESYLRTFWIGEKVVQILESLGRSWVRRIGAASIRTSNTRINVGFRGQSSWWRMVQTSKIQIRLSKVQRTLFLHPNAPMSDGLFSQSRRIRDDPREPFRFPRHWKSSCSRWPRYLQTFAISTTFSLWDRLELVWNLWDISDSLSALDLKLTIVSFGNHSTLFSRSNSKSVNVWGKFNLMPSA
jgi:hypothetical protein